MYVQFTMHLLPFNLRTDSRTDRMRRYLLLFLLLFHVCKLRPFYFYPREWDQLVESVCRECVNETGYKLLSSVNCVFSVCKCRVLCCSLVQFSCVVVYIKCESVKHCTRVQLCSIAGQRCVSRARLQALQRREVHLDKTKRYSCSRKVHLWEAKQARKMSTHIYKTK